MSNHTPSNCPHCGAEPYLDPSSDPSSNYAPSPPPSPNQYTGEPEANTSWTCGTDFVEEWGFSRSSECYERELNTLQQELVATKEKVMILTTFFQNLEDEIECTSECGSHYGSHCDCSRLSRANKIIDAFKALAN
jgi:hypothetical protein